MFQIGLYIYGFLKLKTYNFNKKEIKLENKKFLSVIIPFKNEEHNLPGLIKNLKNQSLEKIHFEVFFINDHSNDNSVNIIGELIKDINHFNLVSLTGFTKRKKTSH